MKRTEKFWDRIARQQDTRGGEKDPVEAKTVERAIPYLAANDVVLDFACGTGTMTVEIAGRVKEMHAIDTSSKMIEIAERRAQEQSSENIHFAQTTIFDREYGPGSFDAVLAFNILHLLEETSQVLKRIGALLRPEGLFISVTPCLGEKGALLARFILLLSKIGIFPYLVPLKVSDLEDLITKSDFVIARSEVLEPGPPSQFIVAKKTA